MTRLLTIFAFLLWISLGLNQAAVAQIPIPGLAGSEEKKEPAGPPPDSLHRETPRDAFVNFVKAVDTANYDKASQYIETLPKKSPEELKKLMEELHSLLDRGYTGVLDDISDNPLGNTVDGLGLDEEEVGSIVIGTDRLPIKMKRISTAAGNDLWFVSTESMMAVPAFYEKAGPIHLPKNFPSFLTENRILSTPLYVWLFAILLIPLAFALGWLLVQAFVLPYRILRRILKRPHTPYPWRSTLPYAVLLTILLHYAFVYSLGLPVIFRHYYGKALNLYFLAGVGFLLYHWADALMRRYQARLVRQRRFNTQSMMTLLQKLVKAGILIFIVLAILNSLGLKITAALAGLGIGGLALALAAQKTLENLFGGMSLLSDQVIRVGEYCKVGDRLGWVEDISLRSTRIRTQDRTLLYVPNGAMAVEKLENYSQRDKFWFHHVLGLRYESTAPQIRRIVHDIQQLFEDHELVETPTAWVRLVKLNSYSIDVELSAYIQVRTNEKNLKIAEELLLQCMEIVEKAGTALAFPSQTSYAAVDSFGAPPPSIK